MEELRITSGALMDRHILQSGSLVGKFQRKQLSARVSPLTEMRRCRRRHDADTLYK